MNKMFNEKQIETIKNVNKYFNALVLYMNSKVKMEVEEECYPCGKMEFLYEYTKRIHGLEWINWCEKLKTLYDIDYGYINSNIVYPVSRKKFYEMYGEERYINEIDVCDYLDNGEIILDNEWNGEVAHVLEFNDIFGENKRTYRPIYDEDMGNDIYDVIAWIIE